MRNLQQTRDGGVLGDIIGVQSFAVEVKGSAPQYAKLGQWWEQAKMQCRDGQLPALAFKLDRMPWIVRCRASDLIPELQPCAEIDDHVDMTLPAFFQIVRERISAEALRDGVRLARQELTRDAVTA